MKINRNNYEAFFIDYLEGNLDEKMVDDFIEFLQKNPDLKEELSLFETVSVQQEEITFNKKELLLKEKFDVENEFNQAALARLEGDISVSENAEFENYLSTHPEKQKENELFRFTKLQPDETIVFTGKNKLYRRSAGRSVLLWAYRAAAVIIIALSVYIYIDKTSTEIITEKQVATIEKVPGERINSAEIKELPKEKDDSEELKITKAESDKPAIKKEHSKSNLSERWSENSPKSPAGEELASIRITGEIPVKLQSLTLIVYAAMPKTDLVPVLTVIPETKEPVYDERLLVDVVKEKTGYDKLTLNKIAKAGLSLVANLSKEKFNYETNAEGKITELSFDSRLLAFSIPTRTGEGE